MFGVHDGGAEVENGLEESTLCFLVRVANQ
jgi:hypothetical protein